MKKAAVFVILAVSVLAGRDFVWSQQRSLEETLNDLSEDAARAYIAPLSSAFGSDLNGAWFHRAPGATKLDFHLELGVAVMATFFPTESKHFSTGGEFVFSVSEAEQIAAGVDDPRLRDQVVEALTTTPSRVQIEGATVIGSPNDFLTVRYPGGTYRIGDQTVNVPPYPVQLPIAGLGELANASALPFAAPQLTLGTVMGTNVTVRWLPNVELTPELGDLSYFGFGIQHNPFAWLPVKPWPLNIALGFYTQRLDFGDLLKVRTTALGLSVSKQLGFRFLNVTPYAGVLLEDADMDVSYQFVISTPAGLKTQDVQFSVSGENSARLLVGINVRVLIANLNVDYNVAKYNSLTAGLNFAL